MTNSKEKTKGIWEWSIVRWIVLSQIIVYTGIFLFSGFDEESARLCIRFTARLSVTLFSLAFAASSIQNLRKNAGTFWLMMNRKYLGISFALTHLLHLFFLGILQFCFHPVFELAKGISLFGGGVAYFFVVVMLITSFPQFSKHLSRNNWKILHTVGGYWIWFIFIRTYYKKVVTEHHEFWPYVIMLIIVLLLRFIRISQAKKFFH